ncbi:MAG: bifunctional (p)ppGpp synthetase/guanosine-3',5'-bis(diphosphate) 3'-pyrophosphohydrolase [Rectinema sp.]
MLIMDEILQNFLSKAEHRFNAEEKNFLSSAAEYTQSTHGDRKRASGEPAFYHDVRVAEILLELGMDLESILAGLLHDTTVDRVSGFSPVPNSAQESSNKPDSGGQPQSSAAQNPNKVSSPQGKSGRTRKEKDAGALNSLLAAPDPHIEELYGKETALIVAGVNRLSSVRAKNKSVHAAETMRKMLFALTSDIRVILVKLADKLDSMRTLKYLPEERQKEIATECIDIYAPLADRLGISWLKDELEDLSLKSLNREVFDQIKDIVNVRKDARQEFLKKVTERILSSAAKEEIEVEVSARAKHFYSIYQKMRKRGKSPEELYDLLGIRIICKSINECYSLLGLVHRLWKPIDGRFKDYIAMPKSNGYQSLHTTVLAYGGQLLEIQIRTREMHLVAEYGVASHWLYKKGTTSELPQLEDLPIINKLKQWNQFIAEGDSYLEEIKRELLRDSIFVFTPKGDVIELPAGSTPIDFAFAIHSDVGGHCLGAKVNGTIASLDSELQNTQIVDIITSPNAKPNLNWLKIAHTSKARSKIRQLLVQTGQAVAIDKHIVAARKSEKAPAESPQARPHAQDRAQAEAQRGRDEGFPSVVEFHSLKPGLVLRSEKAGVSVGGMRNMMIRIAGCCKPVTGDRIVGYVSRGRGIIVHREDCRSLMSIADFDERRIDVKWEDEAINTTARYRVTTKKTVDIFSEIESTVRKCSGRLKEGKLGERGDGTLSGFFILEVDSREDLRRVAKALRTLPSILSIEEETL